MEKFFLYLREKLINDFLFNQADLDMQHSSWIEKRGDSRQSKSDFYWSCLNYAILYYAKNSTSLEFMYQKQRDLYFLMFEFLLKEKRNVTQIQKLINRVEVLKAGLAKFEIEVNFIPGNRCEYAKQFEGVKVPYKTALDSFPLDYDKCDRDGGCVCCLGFEGKRDGEGRLIRK